MIGKGKGEEKRRTDLISIGVGLLFGEWRSDQILGNALQIDIDARENEWLIEYILQSLGVIYHQKNEIFSYCFAKLGFTSNFTKQNGKLMQNADIFKVNKSRRHRIYWFRLQHDSPFQEDVLWSFCTNHVTFWFIPNLVSPMIHW